MGWLFGEEWECQAKLEGKTAVVTGSNTGIGFHVALDFYKRGARVILAGRNRSKLTNAVESIQIQCTDYENLGELDIKIVDLSSLKSVRKCAKQLLAQEKNIHILVNNAGVVLYERELTEDGYEKQFVTNYLGHFLLTLLLLPRLVKSAPSRIINVTSEPHCIANDIDFDDINCDKSYFYHTVYSQTKLANILFSNELARRLNLAKVENVTVYSANPGGVDTSMSTDFSSMIFPGVSWLYSLLKSWFMLSPHQGARTVVYCAVAEQAAHQTGLYYMDCKVALPPKSTKSEIKAKQLWDLSLQMTHLDSKNDYFVVG